jgi:hypothetical protein
MKQSRYKRTILHSRNKIDKQSSINAEKEEVIEEEKEKCGKKMARQIESGSLFYGLVL